MQVVFKADGPASVILSLLLFAVFLVVWYKAARNMARIASDKGYVEKRWFHYCFWLGIAGYLMVCAMPDKNLHAGSSEQRDTRLPVGRMPTREDL